MQPRPKIWNFTVLNFDYHNLFNLQTSIDEALVATTTNHIKPTITANQGGSRGLITFSEGPQCF